MQKYGWFSSEMRNNILSQSWCWLLRLKSDLHDAQQGLFPLQSLSILCIEGFLGDTKDVEDFEFWCRCKTQYFWGLNQNIFKIWAQIRFKIQHNILLRSASIIPQDFPCQENTFCAQFCQTTIPMGLQSCFCSCVFLAYDMYYITVFVYFTSFVYYCISVFLGTTLPTDNSQGTLCFLC